jgi:hypothetical protein
MGWSCPNQLSQHLQLIATCKLDFGRKQLKRNQRMPAFEFPETTLCADWVQVNQWPHNFGHQDGLDEEGLTFVAGGNLMEVWSELTY